MISSKVCWAGFDKKAVALAIVLAGCAANSASAEWQLNGEAGVSGRYFFADPQYAHQSEDESLSVLVRPELGYQSASREHQFRIVPFYRHDSLDDERTHFDLREAYWRWSMQDVHLLAGLQQVFWGVTESRHLVDVINQTDLVENIDQEDKLGQPMLQLTTQSDWGEASLLLLPYFRERSFPDYRARFSLPLPVNTDAAWYASNDEERHLDVALRYSHFLGDWDLGLHLFQGTSREPVLAFENGELVPGYYQMRQAGVDLQYTRDAWLYKGEFIWRDTQDEDFFAAVLGFEYTLFQFADSEKDLGLLMEYLYDDRADFHPVTAFENDIFVGTRLAFNDTADSTLLMGVLFDMDESERFFNVEANTRIGQSIRVELEIRIIDGSRSGDVLSYLKQDDYCELGVSYHF